MTMIRYTERLGDKSATLECETMEQLIQYMKADKSEVVNAEEMVTNESVNKAIDSLDSYAKAWKEREALTKINNVTNNIG